MILPLHLPTSTFEAPCSQDIQDIDVTSCSLLQLSLVMLSCHSPQTAMNRGYCPEMRGIE